MWEAASLTSQPLVMMTLLADFSDPLTEGAKLLGALPLGEEFISSGMFQR